MPRCLYCLHNEENRTFRSVEHVFPESLGNTSIILEKGIVCDQCNNGVLSQLDKTLLEFDPIALLRVNYFIKSKSGKLPKANFGNMSLEAISSDLINIKTNSRKVLRETPNGFDLKFKGSKKFTIDYQKRLCRALFKITLALIFLDHGSAFAFSERYDPIRKIILGIDDFHGYIAILNKAKVIPETQVQYNFSTHSNGQKTTWAYANFMGVTMFTDLEVRIVANPESLGDEVTLFTF